MSIDEAKEKIKSLEQYIDLLDSYKPCTFEQEAIKEYVIQESVTVAAKVLNEKGYRVGNRKVIGTDISDFIRGKATDRMHEQAKKIFKQNRRSNPYL